MTDAHQQSEVTGGTCTKRLWVMLSLSDDEAVPNHDALPQVLRAHLAHCASCRELATGLFGVTDELRRVGELEADSALLGLATSQAISALDRGAALTGRVDVPDDWVEPVAPPVHPTSMGDMARLAAAAAVGLAVLLVGRAFWLPARNSTATEPSSIRAAADTSDNASPASMPRNSAHGPTELQVAPPATYVATPAVTHQLVERHLPPTGNARPIDGEPPPVCSLLSIEEALEGSNVRCIERAWLRHAPAGPSAPFSSPERTPRKHE